MDSTAAASPALWSTFSDGTAARSESERLIAPVRCNACEPTSSIGAALSAAFTPWVRVPVTMTSCVVSVVCAKAAPA